MRVEYLKCRNKSEEVKALMKHSHNKILDVTVAEPETSERGQET